MKSTTKFYIGMSLGAVSMFFGGYMLGYAEGVKYMYEKIAESIASYVAELIKGLIPLIGTTFLSQIETALTEPFTVRIPDMTFYYTIGYILFILGMLGIGKYSSLEVMKKVIEEKTELKVPVEIKEGEDPLKLLKIRYAKGEITKEEYEEMKRILEG